MIRKGRVELALGRALRDARLEPRDGAAVELARAFARYVDKHPDDLNQVGRSFLETLAALGMTPKARAGVVQGAPPAASKLDELRARRERPA